MWGLMVRLDCNTGQARGQARNLTAALPCATLAYVIALTAIDLLHALQALKDADECSVIQPQIANLLSQYLSPRGYSVQLNGVAGSDKQE